MAGVLPLAVPIFIALGIGALIGIERERSESGGEFAGSRTLPLVALSGALTNAFFQSLLIPAFITIALIVLMAYVVKAVSRGDEGITTAVATLLTFVFGAMTVHSREGLILAVALGTITTTLLAAKVRIHAFAGSIGEDELMDTLKFLIIVLVVLPILPDRSINMLWGLNPRFIWLMVVLVSGISLLAYLLINYLGPRRGIGLVGALGGLVSSTATTVSMAERARTDPSLTTLCGFAVAVASIMMFPRVLIEVAIVNPSLLFYLAAPLIAMTVVGLGSAYLILRVDSGSGPEVELNNPFRLQPALIFGAFFALILLASSRGNELFGETGVYATAFLSGLADVNAITLSLSKLALDGTIPSSVATRGIIIGVVTNTFVKLGMSLFLGTRKLAREVGLVLVSAGIVGLFAAFII